MKNQNKINNQYSFQNINYNILKYNIVSLYKDELPEIMLKVIFPRIFELMNEFYIDEILIETEGHYPMHLNIVDNIKFYKTNAGSITEEEVDLGTVKDFTKRMIKRPEFFIPFCEKVLEKIKELNNKNITICKILEDSKKIFYIESNKKLLIEKV